MVIAECRFADCQLTIGDSTSPIANRQSPIANRQSPIANRQSSIGNRHSPIGTRQSTLRESPICSLHSAIRSGEVFATELETLGDLAHRLPFVLEFDVGRDVPLVLLQELQALLDRCIAGAPRAV